MKYLSLLLLLASCARVAPRPTTPESEPISQATAITTAFAGRPMLEVYDLEAAPDSIATVTAEYYTTQARQHKQGLMRAWLISLFH